MRYVRKMLESLLQLASGNGSFNRIALLVLRKRACVENKARIMSALTIRITCSHLTATWRDVSDHVTLGSRGD
jgi:hypothetical protein